MDEDSEEYIQAKKDFDAALQRLIEVQAKENDDEAATLVTGWVLAATTVSPQEYGRSTSYSWFTMDGMPIHTSLGLVKYVEIHLSEQILS